MSDRFAIDLMESDEAVTSHWRMVDGETRRRFYLDTKMECEEKAQEILDIEAGRRPAPEPEEKPVHKVTKYEGLWREGREIDLKTGLPKPIEGDLF